MSMYTAVYSFIFGILTCIIVAPQQIIRNTDLDPRKWWNMFAFDVGSDISGQSAILTRPDAASEADALSEIDKDGPTLLKEFYFKLQNLEIYRMEIGPRASDLLRMRFSEVVSNATLQAEKSILSMRCYSFDKLQQFLQNEHGKVLDLWDEYLTARRHGKPRKLFQNRKDAAVWLKARSPAKLIDGAWLARIHECLSLEDFGPVVSRLRLILFEELGDGHLERNHVYLYRKLLREVGVDLPPAHSEEFGWQEDGLNDMCSWQGAVDQSLLSALCEHHLPEVLGFNLHFEAVTLETLVAARELRELRLDPTYFYLHICIDNADNGHEAMALEAVDEYMRIVSSKHDNRYIDDCWRRIQLGYLMAKDSTPTKAVNKKEDAVAEARKLTDLEKNILTLLEAKSRVAYRFHSSGGKMFSGRAARMWLRPEAFLTETARVAYLSELSAADDLICPGHSSNSWLIQEALWGGKMFGAFSSTEISLLAKWIDSLPHRFHTPDIPASKRCTHVSPIDENNILDPTFVSAIKNKDIRLPFNRPLLVNNHCPNSGPHLSHDLRHMWLAHEHLLENIVSSPSRTADMIVCNLIQVHRAQLGHLEDTRSQVTTSQPACTTTIGLAEIGKEIWKSTQPSTLTQESERFASAPNTSFARFIKELSSNPHANIVALVATACAFTELHQFVCLTSTMKSVDALRAITDIEHAKLSRCLEELIATDEANTALLSTVYIYARQMIVKAGGWERMLDEDQE